MTCMVLIYVNSQATAERTISKLRSLVQASPSPSIISFTCISAAADPDLQIKRESGHPDPEIRGRGGGGLKFFLFSPSGLSLVQN